MRVLIASDHNGRWFLRRIDYNHRDDIHREMVYHCDKHLGGPYKTVDEAVKAMKELPNED